MAIRTTHAKTRVENARSDEVAAPAPADEHGPVKRPLRGGDGRFARGNDCARAKVTKRQAQELLLGLPVDKVHPQLKPFAAGALRHLGEVINSLGEAGRSPVLSGLAGDLICARVLGRYYASIAARAPLRARDGELHVPAAADAALRFMREARSLSVALVDLAGRESSDPTTVAARGLPPWFIEVDEDPATDTPDDVDPDDDATTTTATPDDDDHKNRTDP